MKLARAVERIFSSVDEHGFCVVPSVISKEEAWRMRGIIDAFREREPPNADELGHRRVLHLAAKHEAFVELLCHPLSMAVCQKSLGPDFICSTWTSNTVLPGAGRIYWHVDHPFWTIEPPYPVEPALTMHAIWCLDEFTEGNGATRFIAGSHRRTQLPDHNGNYDHEGITIEAPTGSVIFAHGACWHSAGRNLSDSPRTAIFGRYARSFIIPQEAMNLQLEAIADPSPLVKRLLGAKMYIPQRGLPY